MKRENEEACTYELELKRAAKRQNKNEPCKQVSSLSFKRNEGEEKLKEQQYLKLACKLL